MDDSTAAAHRTIFAEATPPMTNETASPAAAPDALLIASDLRRDYGQHRAVRGVSFALRQGQVLGFLGPNGAGKSTTMQMLAGTLAPSGGRVTIGGHDLLEEPEAAKALVGYLPEQPPLYTELTVDEYLAFCARLRGVARRAVAAAVGTARSRCGLADAGRRVIGNLSKGYQQRVGIAQAIVHSPKVVILDEPTVGLDPIQIREIRDLITELGREHAVILSTHILAEVQSVCTDVQIIRRGELVFAGSLAALDARAGAAALTVVLRAPPAESALAALPGVRTVVALGGGRFRLEGTVDPTAVAAAAVAGSWGLAELAPQRRSLEQVFVDLTTADEPVPAQEQAA
jgi:ABC-2 type transport system ATP-binding protein